MKALLAAGVMAMAMLGGAANAADKLFSHFVLFELKDDTPENRAELIAACEKYLTGHPGEVSFSTGEVIAEMDRGVNVKDFAVSLHIVFDGKASQDLYQDAPRHHEFIAEQNENWASVRVIDTWMTPFEAKAE